MTRSINSTRAAALILGTDEPPKKLFTKVNSALYAACVDAGIFTPSCREYPRLNVGQWIDRQMITALKKYKEEKEKLREEVNADIKK